MRSIPIYKEHIMRKKLSLFKKSSWFRLKASHCNRDSFYYHKDTTQTGQTGKLKNQGGLHHFKIDKLQPIRRISTFRVVFQSDCLAPLESPQGLRQRLPFGNVLFQFVYDRVPGIRDFENLQQPIGQLPIRAIPEHTQAIQFAYREQKKDGCVNASFACPAHSSRTPRYCNSFGRNSPSNCRANFRHRAASSRFSSASNQASNQMASRSCPD